jgi:CheY-like chemotaxis protein
LDTAADGQIGLEKAKKALINKRDGCGCYEPYAMILMDTIMPIMDGFEATKQIKASYKKMETKTKKKIMLKVGSISGLLTAEDKKDLKKVGVDYFIGKPF